MSSIFRIQFFIVILFSQVAYSKTIIDDPEKMILLEKRGFQFSLLLQGQSFANNKDFFKSSRRYQSIVSSLSRDLDKRKSEDKYLSVTMSKKHRLFDQRWLRSPNAFYELVGVVNRMDRSPFVKDPRYRCGEMRFIYRLSYSTKKNRSPIYSRLPLTVNVVYWAGQKGESCVSLARQWQQKPGVFLNRYKTGVSKKLFKSVEINLQAVRWPSTVRPDFGGYAEYFMRVFSLSADRKTMKLSPMENMIDVKRVKSNPQLKRELKAFLTDKKNLSNFDQGIATIPEKFLATKARSVAFHGLARLANRPFDQVFSEKDFKVDDLKSYKTFKTPKAFLRRLNDMSCVGCHQGRAIAGFHFVGVDRKGTHAANAVKMAKSGHLFLDLDRREKFVEMLAAGKKPQLARGFSERLDSEKGGHGAHCTLGKDPSFKNWTCDPGLSCQSIDTATTDDIVGVCLPPKNKYAGDPCDVGRVSQGFDSTRDRVVQKRERACKTGQFCFQARDGFPGGVCHEYCENVGEGEVCGAIAFNGFNPCLARGESFITCLEKYTGDMTMKSCDESEPCRDDFVCTNTKSSGSKGACIPPYFLFQLRLDGHPSP